MGQFHYETDGFRQNNDLQQNIFNVFTQVELSLRTSIQAEFRATRVHKGDLDLRFDPDNFLPQFREEDDIQSLRLGLRHAFRVDSIILLSAILQNFRAEATFEPEVNVTNNQDGYTAEFQHLYRPERFSLVSGLGNTDATRTVRASRADPQTQRTDVRHTNFYEYATSRFWRDLAITLGASVDLFDGIVESDQFNPKFGVTWTPVPVLTLRGAAFRTLQRTLTANQTVEPTQVAGFNQFFADGEGTDAWRYGVGSDFYKVTSRLYVGAEASWRDLEVPGQIFVGAPQLVRGDWNEQLARAYLYGAPTDWLVLGSEYLYEEFKRNPDFFNAGEKTDIETHRFPLFVGLYHPSGFSARFQASHIDQHGTFGVPAQRKEDAFWVPTARSAIASLVAGVSSCSKGVPPQ